MLIYRIVGKRVVVDLKRKEQLVCIEGWTFLKTEQVEVEGEVPFGVKYKNTSSLKKYFSLQAILPVHKQEITLAFGTGKEKATISLQTVTQEKWEMDQPLLYCFVSGDLNQHAFYFLDEGIYLYSQKRWIVKGWLVSDSAVTKIESVEEELDHPYREYERKDLRNSKIVEHPEKETGFVFGCGKKDKVAFSVEDANYGKLVVKIPSKEMKQYYKITSQQGELEEDIRRYGADGLCYREQLSETIFTERRINSTPYKIEKPDALFLAKDKKITVIVAIQDGRWVEEIKKQAKSWLYEKLQLIFCGNVKEEKTEALQCVPCTGGKEDCLLTGLKNATGEGILFLDQEDQLEPEALSYLCGLLNKDANAAYGYMDYGLFDQGASRICVKRKGNLEKERTDLFFTGLLWKKEAVSSLHSLGKIREDLLKGQGIHGKVPMLHYACTEDVWGNSKGKPVAFYLPQYHITEENNAWWGEGFTEWCNVRRGKPYYNGHHQPRIPGELGYYDLVEDPEKQKQQNDLAKAYGMYGFCYYYYWFKGKRLLRKPLDQYLENKELDLPFCICWANENWTRRWDGQEREILMEQVHNPETDEAFIRDILPLLKDGRYIKSQQAPILLIYRIGLFSYPAETICRWRRICREEGIGEIKIGIVQSFQEVDHRMYGADFSVEFPPHMTTMMEMDTLHSAVKRAPEFSGRIYDYKKLVEQLGTIEKRAYELCPGAMLEWDNTARRQERADIYAGFTPESFRIWMIRNNHYAKLYRKDPFLFINAWNEWAEGTYLEPDEKWGRKNLEIVKEVVSLK